MTTFTSHGSFLLFFFFFWVSKSFFFFLNVQVFNTNAAQNYQKDKLVFPCFCVQIVRFDRLVMSRLVPENFGAEPNIDSSVCAGFVCFTISGKLRNYMCKCLSEFLFSMHYPEPAVLFEEQATSEIPNVLDVRQNQIHV